MMRKKYGYKRCVVVVNPVSSNYDRGQQLIRQLAALFPVQQFETIELRLADYERPSWLITRLNAALDKNTLLAIAGGDGTNNLVIDTLMRSSAIANVARNVTILPLWAGNANDLAHMANGNPPRSIETIIKRGNVVRVHPLIVTTQHTGKTTTRLAVCYVSLGASAYASARISKPSHRGRRIYRLPGARNLTDMASVTRAFIGAATFESDIDGAQRRIYDLAMINGPRIAKVSRIPVKLTSKNFYEVMVVRKHPAVLSYLMHIIRGTDLQRRTRTERELTINETTWAQIDGEPVQIPGNTTISIQPYDRAFHLISTKLVSDNT